MLEFYIQNRKRWKDRSLNKRRRALLNGMSTEGEATWSGLYIPALRREWDRDTVSPYRRYLSRQVGKYAPDVYSDLSHRPIYRQNRYLLKEAFMREMQYEWDYRRDWKEFIEEVPKTYVKRFPMHLRAYDTGFEGKWFAKYLVWYPYHNVGRVVIDKGEPPITGYLYTVGWYGYYTRTEDVYTQELLLDSKGRPLFTKQEYDIHTKDGRRRVIPVGGPLLRETVTTTTRSEWKYLGNGWDWNMRPYAGSEKELDLLKEELGRI
jgi:hypothetical protein